MFSFRVEYTIRILIEMEMRARAGIMGIPIIWFQSICGGDTRGLSITMRILLKIGWVSCDKKTYLYSSNVDVNVISLYDVCLQIEDTVNALPQPLRGDRVSTMLMETFENIKLSDFIEV